MLLHDGIFFFISRGITRRCAIVRVSGRRVHAHTREFIVLIHALEISLVAIGISPLLLFLTLSVSCLGNVYSHCCSSRSKCEGHSDRIRGEIHVILRLVFFSVFFNLISKYRELSVSLLDNGFPSLRHLHLCIFSACRLCEIFFEDRELSLGSALSIRVALRSVTCRSIFRLRRGKCRLFYFRSRHIFLSRRGAYLSHNFVFELICHH